MIELIFLFILKKYFEISLMVETKQVAPNTDIGEKKSNKLNLFICGRKLRDLDALSKSDPQCLVFEM